MSRSDPRDGNRRAATPTSARASRSGAYAVIGSGVRDRRAAPASARTSSINGPTTIGADNRIFQFASIGDAPQDQKYKGEPTRLEIGDRNVFREFTTMNRGTIQGRRRHAHRRRQPVHGVHARGARLPRRQPVRAGELRHARRARAARRLGDHGRLLRHSPVHKVGAHAFLGNNSAVTRDVPPYVMAVGRPRCRTRSTRKA